MMYSIFMKKSNPWDQIFKNGIPDDLVLPYETMEEVVKRMKQCSDNKVLDVAMGAGRHTIFLAERGFDVYGFDISENGIELTKIELQRKKVNATLSIQDMFKPFSYSSGFFDAVIATQAIYHGYRKQMESSIAEIHRVLKKGGLFFFTTSLNPNRSMRGSNEKGMKYMKKIDEKTLIPLVGREKGLVHFYPTENDILEMLSNLYTDVTIRRNEDQKYLEIFCFSKT